MTQQNAIQIFEGNQVRVAWNEEEEKYYFSIVDVVQILTEQPTPRKASTYWAVLKKRLKEEGADELLTNCKQLKMPAADGKNTGAYLDNLEVEYSYIHHRQPMFSKPGGRNSRWQLDDCFLRFWFRFILRNQALVEMERNDLLLEIVERGYEQYSGLVLEQYFRQKWMEEERVTLVGNYWDRKGVNEIDMIAINDIDKKAVVAEVKRQRKKLNSSELAGKVSTISKNLAKYEVRQIGLTMEDM